MGDPFNCLTTSKGLYFRTNEVGSYTEPDNLWLDYQVEEITIMQGTEIPLYLDWSFWAVIVAFIAVLLSQIPPIKELVKKAKLDLEVYSKISITHKVGNPNLMLHLIITNIGGRNIRIKDICVSLSRDGKVLFLLPAQNYLQNQNDQNTLLFTTFSLVPNQEWAHIANFLNLFDRVDEKKYQDIEGDMIADYRAKAKELETKEGTRSNILKNWYLGHLSSLIQNLFGSQVNI